MSKKYVTFGEIMLRLRSQELYRLFQTPSLEATFGGGEANVAVSLSIFGEKATFVTALPDEKAAAGAADEFAKLGMAINNGNSSIFMNKEIEVMKSTGLGKNGHLAFKCNDIERAIYFLKDQGFTVKEDTVKLDAKGKIKVCYLNEEVGGFAIHLIK